MASSRTAPVYYPRRPMDEEVWHDAVDHRRRASSAARCCSRSCSTGSCPRRGRATRRRPWRAASISPETDTRLRFVRRLIYAVIVLIGLRARAVAVPGLKSSPRRCWPPGAIAAAILGFAARQTLANFVAGIMLAVTQPLRVGDWVFVEDHYGVVEDVRLNYTFLRTPAGQQVVDPEREARRRASCATTRSATATSALDVSALAAARRPTPGARSSVLEEETGSRVTVAEVDRRGRAAGRRRRPAARRPSAPAREAACACACLAACTPRGCSGCTTPCSREGVGGPQSNGPTLDGSPA